MPILDKIKFIFLSVFFICATSLFGWVAKYEYNKYHTDFKKNPPEYVSGKIEKSRCLKDLRRDSSSSASFYVNQRQYKLPLGLTGITCNQAGLLAEKGSFVEFQYLEKYNSIVSLKLNGVEVINQNDWRESIKPRISIIASLFFLTFSIILVCSFISALKNQKQYLDRKEKLSAEKNKSKKITSIVAKLTNAFLAIGLFSYGTYGVWINDLYFPAKHNMGLHLHNLPAWIMYGAIICACLCMLLVIMDKNDNQNHKFIGNILKWSGFALFSLALILIIMTTKYDKNFVDPNLIQSQSESNKENLVENKKFFDWDKKIDLMEKKDFEVNEMRNNIFNDPSCKREVIKYVDGTTSNSVTCNIKNQVGY